MLTKLDLGRLKLISPTFSTPYHGGWRKHVTATWKFLGQHYTIDSPPSCGTHTRIYLARTRPMQQLRRIAQAVVHFEPAFLDLMPPYRRGNCLAKSNWLNSPGFRRGRLSRAESIDRIGKAVDASELIELMHSNPEDEHYSWSFLGLKSSRDPSVEFRQPPGSVSWEECLSWAELTAMFIGAALRGRDWALQKDGPTNVQALYRFIETSSVPGMAANDSWKRLWPLAEGRDKGSCQALRRDNVLGRMQPRRE
jgi:Putative amidoligase enzyme